MKISLYQIEKEYITLAESIIDNDGEVTDETFTALQINKEQLESKGACYGFIVKEITGQVDVIDLEIERLTALKKSRNKTIDRLKDTLSKAMELYEIEKIETPILKISFRKSKSVEVENVELLDKNYVMEKTTKSADKIKLKYYLEQGEVIAGAILKENKNIQIK